MNDKRIFERFTARFPAKFADSHLDYGKEVLLKDASASGMKLLTKRKLFVNDGISLLVKLPDHKDPVSLNGRVVWSKDKDLSDMRDLGIELFKLDFLRMSRIYKFVKDAV